MELPSTEPTIRSTACFKVVSEEEEEPLGVNIYILYSYHPKSQYWPHASNEPEIDAQIFQVAIYIPHHMMQNWGVWIYHLLNLPQDQWTHFKLLLRIEEDLQACLEYSTTPNVYTTWPCTIYESGNQRFRIGSHDVQQPCMCHAGIDHQSYIIIILDLSQLWWASVEEELPV